MQNVPTLPKLLTSPTFRLKAVAGAVVVAGLLLASVFSIRFALADATAANVDAAFTTAYVDAYRGGAVIKLSDQARWLDEIKHANALAPANGAHHELAFQIHGTSLSLMEKLEVAQIIDQIKSAVRDAQNALVQRPMSPNAWANLALAESWLMLPGTVSPGFSQAMENAVRFGPWEREVSMVVVDLGFATWDVATPAARQATEATMLRLGLRYPEEVITAAEKRGKLALPCGNTRWQKHQKCRDFLNAGPVLSTW